MEIPLFQTHSMLSLSHIKTATVLQNLRRAKCGCGRECWVFLCQGLWGSLCEAGSSGPLGSCPSWVWFQYSNLWLITHIKLHFFLTFLVNVHITVLHKNSWESILSALALFQELEMQSKTAQRLGLWGAYTLIQSPHAHAVIKMHKAHSTCVFTERMCSIFKQDFDSVTDLKEHCVYRAV